MIYAFLSDEAFALIKAQGSVMTVSDIQSYTLGMVDDNLLNYFDNHTIITDPVGSAKAGIIRNNRLLVDDSINNYAVGKMLLHFDSTKLGEANSKERAAIKALTINVDEDDDTVIRTKVEARASLFNILETIFFARDTNKHIKSIEAINTLLNNALSTTYKGYVSESLKLSSTVTPNAAYRYNVSGNVNSNGNCDFYDWCTFTYRYGEGQNDLVDIKVWLSVPEFKANYPFSTITDIIYPCKPEWILNPEVYGSEVRAVLQSASYKDTSLDTAITSRDHSGLVVYKSTYRHPTVSYDAQMGFVVLYKGAAPSSASMRVAIRTKLLAEKNKNTGSLLALEEDWKKVLPDLFVDQGFYIFPCYYQRYEVGDRTIERSVSNYRTMFDRLKMIFTGNEFTLQELFDNMEILQAPAHNMYLVAMPVDLQTNIKNSILSIHPTYQPLDSIGSVINFVPTSDTKFVEKEYYYQNPNKSYEFIPLVKNTDYEINDAISSFGQTVYERVYVIEKDDWNSMTSAAKAFAWSLAECLAACIDKTISIATKPITVELMGTGEKREYYSFISNSTEYHVLTIDGAKGVFDTLNLTNEDEEHVDGYIH